MMRLSISKLALGSCGVRLSPSSNSSSGNGGGRTTLLTTLASAFADLSERSPSAVSASLDGGGDDDPHTEMVDVVTRVQPLTNSAAGGTAAVENPLKAVVKLQTTGYRATGSQSQAPVSPVASQQRLTDLLRAVRTFAANSSCSAGIPLLRQLAAALASARTLCPDSDTSLIEQPDELLPILKIIALSGIATTAPFETPQIDGAGDNNSVDAHHRSRWFPGLWAELRVAVASTAATMGLLHCAKCLHYLTLLSHASFDEDLFATLCDNIAVFASSETDIGDQEAVPSPSVRIEVELGQQLEALSLILDAVLHHCQLLSPIVAGMNAPQQYPSAANMSIDPAGRAEQRLRFETLMNHRPHPVANAAFFSVMTNWMARILNRLLVSTTQAKTQNIWRTAGVNASVPFFIMRSVAKLPWCNEAATATLLQTVGPLLRENASMSRSVMQLLSKPGHRVSDIQLVLDVLDILNRDLSHHTKAALSASRLQRGQQHQPVSLMYVDWQKLPSFLLELNAMLRVALQEAMLERGPHEALEQGEGGGRDRGGEQSLKILQTQGKMCYSLLCDNMMAATTSFAVICRFKIIDIVLHHLVCLAPRDILHHEFVIHLVFALTQVLPSVAGRSRGTASRGGRVNTTNPNSVSVASRHRIQAVVERLIEEGFVDALTYSIPTFRLTKSPMLVDELRSILVRKMGLSPPSEGGDLPIHLDQHSPIAYVSFRRVMEQWEQEERAA